MLIVYFYTHAQTDSTHFKQVDLTVRVVVVLEAVEGVVVSVAVHRAHRWTRIVAAVKKTTMANTEKTGMRNKKTEAETLLLACFILISFDHI